MTNFFDDQVTAPPSRRSQRHRRQSDGSRKRGRAKNAFTFLVMLGAIALMVGGAFFVIRPLLEPQETAVQDFPGPGSGSVEVVVAEGDSGAVIGAELVDKGVVATAQAFITAFNANPAASGIQPGTYQLQLEMRAADAVLALLDANNRSDTRITVNEGWRASQIYERIASVMEVDLAEVETAAAELSLPAEAEGNPEGWLYPLTYVIGEDDTPQDVLQRMVDRMVQELDSLGVPEGERQDLLNKASIVEAEMNYAPDRPKVARVIENRLLGCSGDGTIGMDTTLAYGLNTPAYLITSEQWRSDHPYNTRPGSTPGLPPGPIANPSTESIQAALNPEAGDWCYFVTVDPSADPPDTRFTASYEEHQANARLYQEYLSNNSDEDSEG